MRLKSKPTVDAKTLLVAVGQGRTTRDYRKSQPIFSQGDRADAVFFVHRGKVKLTVLSRQGKQAVIALLGPGDFFGEVGLLGARWQRTATVVATSPMRVLVVARRQFRELLFAAPTVAARIQGAAAQRA